MACDQLTEILRGCDNNLGGIKRFLVTNFDNVVSTTEVAGEITVIAMAVGTGFVEYSFNKNSCSFVEDGTIDLTNGSTFYSTTTTLMIPRREVAKRNSLALLASGQQDLMIIMEDQNGLFWLQGWSNGANLTAQGEGSGAAKADGSKYSLTFLSEEPEQMPEVDSTIVDALIL